MTIPHLRAALTLSLLALAGGAASQGSDEAHLSDLPFPGVLPVDAAGRAGFAVTCVLDARTGEPIAGARVSAIFDAACPLSGEWWSARSEHSGEDGWVRVRLDDLRAGRGAAEPWYFVEASGYAPAAALGAALGASVYLEHAEDVEVWVRDSMDRPVEGAHLGWLLGCGHTPDVRTARTDVRGRALLEDIARDRGELWPVARGLESSYGHLSDSSIALVRLAPGIRAHGRIVDSSGEPLAGVFVGNSLTHRGPWARTDVEGRFELIGLPPRSGVVVQREGGAYGELGIFELPDDGREVTLVVPAPSESLLGRVSIALRDATSGQKLAGLAVTLVRAGDGFTVRGLSDGEGEAELAAAAGTYSVLAGGDLSGWEPSESELELGSAAVGAGSGDAEDPDARAEALRLELALEPSPRIRVDARSLPEGAEVFLVSALEVRPVDPGEPLAVPRSGPLGLGVELQDRVWAVELEAAERTLDAVIELGSPEPALLRFQLADPAGRPARGWALLLEHSEPQPEAIERAREQGPAAEGFELPTWRVGGVDLLLIPEDPALAPRRQRLDLTPEGAVLQLGTLRFLDPLPFVLTVSEAGGAPLAGARLEVRRDTGRHALALDEHGRLTADTFALLPGDHLRVESESWPPFRFQIVGPGPWSVTRSTSSLALEVLDEDGFGVPGFILWIDGELFEAPGSAATLAGLTPGLRRAVISAPGRLSMVLNFELDHDEQRSIGFVLPRRR